MNTGKLISTRIGFLQTKLYLVLGNNGYTTSEAIQQHAYFEDGRVVGTDARILVEQCLHKIHGWDQEQMDCVNGKALHSSDLKLLEKCDIIRFHENGILGQLKKQKAWVWCEFRELPRPYLKWKKVIPTEKKKLDEFSFRPDLFSTLTRAMGVKTGVKMHFFDLKSGSIVVAAGQTVGDQYGLIMPYRID